MDSARAYDGDLFQDLLDRERAAGTRIIAETEHFTVFVPAAAKWPLEAMVLPNEEVPDFAALTDAQRADLADSVRPEERGHTALGVCYGLGGRGGKLGAFLHQRLGALGGAVPDGFATMISNSNVFQ